MLRSCRYWSTPGPCGCTFADFRHLPATTASTAVPRWDRHARPAIADNSLPAFYLGLRSVGFKLLVAGCARFLQLRLRTFSKLPPPHHRGVPPSGLARRGELCGVPGPVLVRTVLGTSGRLYTEYLLASLLIPCFRLCFGDCLLLLHSPHREISSCYHF